MVIYRVESGDENHAGCIYDTLQELIEDDVNDDAIIAEYKQTRQGKLVSTTNVKWTTKTTKGKK